MANKKGYGIASIGVKMSDAMSGVTEMARGAGKGVGVKKATYGKLVSLGMNMARTPKGYAPRKRR